MYCSGAKPETTTLQKDMSKSRPYVIYLVYMTCKYLALRREGTMGTNMGKHRKLIVDQNCYITTGICTLILCYTSSNIPDTVLV